MQHVQIPLFCKPLHMLGLFPSGFHQSIACSRYLPTQSAVRWVQLQVVIHDTGSVRALHPPGGKQD